MSLKFSAETISSLKYFSTISSSIVLNPGNLISTQTPGGLVLSTVKIIEDIPEKVGIYNLPEFLNILSVFKEPELNFTARNITISEGPQKVAYTCSEPSLIPGPKGSSLKELEVVTSFTLPQTEIQSLQKSMNIMNLPHLIIQGDSENVYIKGKDEDNSSSSSYEYKICDTDKTFTAILKVENLKLMNIDYSVTLTNRYIKFKGIGRDVTTWIMLEAKSKF